MLKLASLAVAAVCSIMPMQCSPSTYGHFLDGHGDAPPELTGCARLQWYRIDWGLPAGFDSIAYRESRCIPSPSVRTSCCVGPLQLYVRLFLRDHRMAPQLWLCGVRSEYDVDGPEPLDLKRHYCVARALYSIVGYSPWR